MHALMKNLHIKSMITLFQSIRLKSFLSKRVGSATTELGAAGSNNIQPGMRPESVKKVLPGARPWAAMF